MHSEACVACPSRTVDGTSRQEELMLDLRAALALADGEKYVSLRLARTLAHEQGAHPPVIVGL